MTRNTSIKRGIVLSGAVAALSLTGNALAQGLDEAGGKYTPNYVTDSMLLDADKDANNWLLYGRDYQTTRYSPLSQINQSNVHRLAPKWQLSFGVLDGQDSQAVAVNGTVYVTSSYNKVWSVDGATGKVNWKYERELPGDVFPKLCCDVVNRGVAVYHNKVYLATLDAHLVALNASTGKVVFDKKVGDYTYAETFTIMPMALRGKIILGTAGAEYGVRGWISALDAETGEQVWKTYTIPAKGEPGNETWAGDSWKYGGGSAWITGSYDRDTNTIYWPVGNPGPDFDRHVRAGDNLFTNSNLAMDPDTGKIKSYFNYTPNDPYDYDGVNEIILADVGGKKMWFHGSRNGHVYGIDRATTTKTAYGNEHKCVWVTAMQRVNWTLPLTPDNNCKPKYNYPEKDVTYDKVTRDIAPSLDGGKEWHPMSYSHRTKMIYVPGYDFTMDLQAKKMEWKRGEWYLGAKVLNFNEGAGYVKAFDAATGKMVWGRSQSTPGTGGTTSTGGGLVFYGDPEGMFNAVRDDTGELLYSFQVGSGIHGNVTTYTANGKQFVAVVAGAGGGGIWTLTYGDWLKKQSKGGMLTVFGLHD
jgi:alcohol dehydrogenase (cytochrome c)